MKQHILIALAFALSATLNAQSLTPTVIATAGFGYSSPDLQVDMTIGETFITTLQVQDVMLTQGFHQPEGGAVSGCTSESACNYNPDATEDDGSCLFVGLPCDDGDPTTIDVVTEECTCEPLVVGCTAPNACNFNPEANMGDFSCLFIGQPCDDFDPTTILDVTTADCICQGQVVNVLGCTDTLACNYDPTATSDSGGCAFPGDECNDGDETTINDTYNADCECAGPLAVGEIETEIRLYPNPASNEVFITIGGQAPNEVQIFDATGRFVTSMQRISRIDIQTLAAGMYTFRVVHEGGVWEQQIIKQN
jgi:hypothetical protein